LNSSPDSSGILFFPIFIGRKDRTDGGKMDERMPCVLLLNKKAQTVKICAFYKLGFD